MIYECSLEIVIKNTDCSELAALAMKLPNKYMSSVSSKTGHLSISINDFDFNDWLVFDKTACDFIEGLKVLGERLALEDSVFRIAVYYSLDETVVLPLKFSKSLVKLISELSLSLDMTGYPCSDES
ncbi:hypothetical protein HU764_000665 [Pseudomonas sp. SWRI100]|uniref:hypothetical protein n=1 Tax=Pseudomonas TaxID=286 RepID=UPI001647A17C|nr:MULTISPECIES: hypothetical protein [Pseudomonas]MBC3499367.1 hypothetical protein [Pseudomonas sp. SWRI67]MBV4524617.1 hypothetical protein [Pseudomonas kermanshahensis]